MRRLTLREPRKARPVKEGEPAAKLLLQDAPEKIWKNFVKNVASVTKAGIVLKSPYDRFFL